MHGAWAFDLLLFVATGAATVLAFRQLTMEHDEHEWSRTIGREPPVQSPD
jgi:hypothetical protein